MTQESLTIERADRADAEEILEILTSVDLPHEGVLEHLGGFLIARYEAGTAMGCIGLERHGDFGLLRSAAVLTEYQSQGIGRLLVRQLLERAAADGLVEVALLTTTAKEYFQKEFGFIEASRDGYGVRFQDSAEWNLPRCSSAAFMTLAVQTLPAGSTK
jgi:amino-acid N-acetyltransferase